ncbi:MAG: hypothetical protein MR316_05310 [Lachnospiraceae bacterium]|nr:hypothetical protein [Lachnospiraceae bacterium]
MSLSDKLLNAVTGSNITTHKVSVYNLAEIIDQTFLQNADRYQIDMVERAIKGKIFAYTDIDSPDGNFRLHISYFMRGLTQHRTVWVKNYETEDIWEWSGFSLSPLKRAMQHYLNSARLR